jgi:hypothetical protein
MAAYLRSLKLPPKSRIAICSKNCAHWILADWAIWMADHVSVPLYPNLNASTVRFANFHMSSSLDRGPSPIWDEMKAVPEVLRVAFLAPRSADALGRPNCAARAAAERAGERRRDSDHRLHFRQHQPAGRVMLSRRHRSGHDRICQLSRCHPAIACCLPALAHTMGAGWSTAAQAGFQVFSPTVRQLAHDPVRAYEIVGAAPVAQAQTGVRKLPRRNSIAC